MGVGAAIGGALAAGGTIAAGVMQSSAQRAAANASLAGIQGTNRANLALYLASRGAPITFNANGAPILPDLSGESSSLYPYYMSGSEGTAGNNASLLTAALNGSPVSSLNLVNPGYTPVSISGKQRTQMAGQLQKLNAQIKGLKNLSSPTAVQQARLQQLQGQANNLKQTVDAVPGQGGTIYRDRNGNFVPQSTATMSGTGAGGNPYADQIKAYKDMIAQFSPDAAAANKTASDLVSGRMTQQMLAEAQPTMSATTGAAVAQKNAGLAALAKTLNDIDAIQAKRGFAGDSLGSRLTKFSATQGIYDQAANTMSQANLSNAQMGQSIRQAGRNLQLNNLGLPDTMANAAISRSQMPRNAVISDYLNSLAPMNNFKLGVGNPSGFMAPPTPTPIPGAGQIVGQTLGALGGNIMQASINQNNNQQVLNGLAALNNPGPNSISQPAGASFGTSAQPPMGTPITAPSLNSP